MRLSPTLNWTLASIATVAGMVEILSWLPRTVLVTILVLGAAFATWILLCRFGVSGRRIAEAAKRRRQELGY